MVIGQAFGAAYKEFLMSIGVSEESLEEAEYAHILNAQTVPQAEVDSLSDRSKSKKVRYTKRHDSHDSQNGKWMTDFV